MTETAGIVRIARPFFDEPAEIQRRLLQRVILWIAPGDYAPRGAAVQALLARLASGKSAQLAGCHFLPDDQSVLAFREARAVRDLTCDGLGPWDGCWHFDGPRMSGATLRALGAAGLAQMGDWRALGLPRAALMSLPSLWVADQLLMAPCATMPDGPSGNWRVRRVPDAQALFQSVLSH